MALLGRHAERTAAGQLPCRHAKVHISYGSEHDLDLEDRISASFLRISHGGFSSLLCPLHLLDECFTMSYKESVALYGALEMRLVTLWSRPLLAIVLRCETTFLTSYNLCLMCLDASNILTKSSHIKSLVVPDLCLPPASKIASSHLIVPHPFASSISAPTSPLLSLSSCG